MLWSLESKPAPSFSSSALFLDFRPKIISNLDDKRSPSILESIVPSCFSHSRFSAGPCPWVSRQEYWSGLPCPPAGNVPKPGIELISFISCPRATWEACRTHYHDNNPILMDIINHCPSESWMSYGNALWI